MPNDDHSRIAIGLATEFANRIADMLPSVEQGLRAGSGDDTILVRLRFRLGLPGEAPVVAEILFEAPVTMGPQILFPLIPSPTTGFLSLAATPEPPMQPPIYNPNQYPAQQAVPMQQAPPALVPRPLPPRQELPPPAPGQQLIQPPPLPPDQVLTPEQYAQQYAKQNQGDAAPAAPAPAPAKKPVRLIRPPMADEGGIRRTQ